MPNAILQEKVLLVREANHLAPGDILLLALIGTSILLSRLTQFDYLYFYRTHRVLTAHSKGFML